MTTVLYIHFFVFFCVAFPAKQFKIIPIQSNVRIVYILSVQVYLVMYYFPGYNQSFVQAPFTQSAPALDESGSALFPTSCIIKSLYIFIRHKKRKRRQELLTFPASVCKERAQ